MSDKPRIGMISFAHIHAFSYLNVLLSMPDIELVGIADDDAERGRQVAAEAGLPYLDSEEALLEEADGVIVTTENVRHREMVLRAAQADVDVMCEKPLATTMADGREMISACREAGVQLMAAFPCRFAPAFVEARQMIETGQLGRILAINATNRGRNPGGWFVQPELSGGGTALDHTVHIVDLMRVVTGQEPATVYAELDTVYNPELEVEDCGLLSIEFGDGCIAALDCSWSRPPHYPVWGDATMTIIGERGNVAVDLFREHLDYYNNDDQSYTWAAYGESPDHSLISAFVHSVRSGEPVPATGEDGLRAVEVALAAYESVEQGGPVSLPLQQ
ncbi:MAG: Gfo/Idh/MocA family oxidoreductase [Armatimonadetes bacterium]|nr:Gfo/Idh/MocA family oxidoreductase [Armatimonadota bacterium]